jgi:LacI family transcriptional regulator
MYMPVSRVTVHQIARAAGVSAMTVSLALRNHPRISAATRQRIRDLAARLGYRPDPTLARLMRHLRQARSAANPPTVAYLVSARPEDRWQDSYQGQLFDGARDRAEALGYKLEVFHLKEPGMTARRMTSILLSRGIEGVLIAPMKVAGGHLSLDLSRFAVAAVGATLWRPLLHRAHHDYYHGTLLMLRTLKRRGYQHIGLLTNTGLARMSQHQEEAAYGYSVARIRQRPIPILLVPQWDTAVFLRWFDRYRPDAIVTCFPDVISALAYRGVRVPDEVGVTVNWQPDGSSRLAGIQQHFRDIGAASFDLVEGQLRRHEYGLPPQPKTVLIRGSWVDGTSVRSGIKAGSHASRR